MFMKKGIFNTIPDELRAFEMILESGRPSIGVIISHQMDILLRTRM